MASSSKQRNHRRPMGRLALGVFMAVTLGLIAAQSSPAVTRNIQPLRAAVGDALVWSAGLNPWSRVSLGSVKDKRIAALEQENSELSRYKAVALSMGERLEVYEDILNVMGEPSISALIMGDAASGLSAITVRVTAESDGPFSETMLANAGRAQDVHPGSIAINEGGLVGRVIELGERSSRILMVTDFNSRVPVMGEVSGLRGIMVGGRDGLGALRDLPESGGFVTGERLLTTGEGGSFPRGLVAGRVREIGGAWRVDLAMRDGRGSYVRLIQPVLIPKPEAFPVAATPPEDEQATPPTQTAGQ